eukprot:765293-Hanusia_phi.AAC.3
MDFQKPARPADGHRARRTRIYSSWHIPAPRPHRINGTRRELPAGFARPSAAGPQQKVTVHNGSDSRPLARGNRAPRPAAVEGGLTRVMPHCGTSCQSEYGAAAAELQCEGVRVMPLPVRPHGTVARYGISGQ